MFAEGHLFSIEGILGVSFNDISSASMGVSDRCSGEFDDFLSLAWADVGDSTVPPLVSLRRCRGVGVSGVDGGLPLEAPDGVLPSPFVHGSSLNVFGSGVPTLDAVATNSSDDFLVCENDGETMLACVIPRPSSLAATARSTRSASPRLVVVADGTLKSSCDS